MENRDMEEFCKNSNLKCLIRVPLCYKNANKPSCIDVTLAKSQRSFQSCYAIETVLFDFDRMTVTLMKTSFWKLKPKVINYRNYKRFCNESYRNELVTEFSKPNFEKNSSEKFPDVWNKVLVRMLHINRNLWETIILYYKSSLSKAIMKKTGLRDKFFKEKVEENRRNNEKQQNYCVTF